MTASHYNGYNKGLASQFKLATGKGLLGWPIGNMSFFQLASIQWVISAGDLCME